MSGLKELKFRLQGIDALRLPAVGFSGQGLGGFRFLVPRDRYFGCFYLHLLCKSVPTSKLENVKLVKASGHKSE